MAEVKIYTAENCPYCAQAKKLLDEKGAKYQEIHVDTDTAKRDEMVKLSGKRSVPQIFINGKNIGGSDALANLNRSGELDKLLKA